MPPSYHRNLPLQPAATDPWRQGPDLRTLGGVRGRAIVPGLTAAVLLAGCGTSGTAGVAASCVGPLPALAPAAATVGQQVTYTVEWLHSGCRDTNPSDEVEQPLRRVRVQVVQGTGHAVVGRVSGTGEHFRGTLTFALPAWLRPGPAEIALDPAVGRRLTFTVVAAP